MVRATRHGSHPAMVAIVISLVFVSLALVPVGAGVGAVVGAVRAESAEKVESADSTLKAAFERLDPANAIKMQLLKVIREHSLRTVVMVDENRLTGLDDFAALVEDGIDTILELQRISISLMAPGSPESRINPQYEFKMEIQTRLIRPDGSRLHERTFDVTEKRKFVDWAAHDAQALLAETDRATRKLAEQIVDHYLRKPVLVDPALSNLPASRPSAW